MKTCPRCGQNLPDQTLFCPVDGAPLTGGSAGASGGGVKRRGDLVGTPIFGEYTITKKLGEGGMGAVYLAEQDSIGQKIAIKVLTARAAESDEIVLRFRREAQVISMLTHPNIIRVFIFGSTPEGQPYLAMEFVRGRELREAMMEGMMDELLIIKILKQACSALAEAHDLNIIHRDLKPDNILLTGFRGEENFVKILDFGIAKIKQPEGQQEQKLTQAGIVYGTPEYLSPEQAQALELDRRTDIYSLGVMLYEMMCGQVPFKSDSAVEILTAHVFNEPTPPSKVAPAGRVSPTMEGIIKKAMAKDPGDRFQDALEMFRALVRREQEILQTRGLGAEANWVPGSELTGMFQAVGAPGAAPGKGASSSPEPTMEVQRPNAAYMQTQGQAQIAAGGGPGAGALVQTDSTRKMILMVIALASVILMLLLAIIVVLLLTG